MFLSKLALYGTIAGTFFAVSAFSTVQITKQMNKVAVPNEEEEIEEDDIPYKRQMSDTEQFINTISNFGNLEGHLDASIQKGMTTVTVSGDVFVSMETMDNVQFDADLTINAFDHSFDVDATYVDGVIYASIDGSNIKLETSALSGIGTLISAIEIKSPVELPESFKNIDANQLISNLSAMTSEKSEDKITYSCNLIEGIPPITFISDLDYKLTSLSLKDADIAGFKINADASINILGKGQNRVTSPETSLNTYTDLTNDVNELKQGIVHQINTVVANKAIGISNYHIEVLKQKKTIEEEKEVITNELVFNMDGSADICLPDLKDISKANINLLGNMTNTTGDKKLDSNVDFKMYEGSLYFDYNNQLKLRYSIEDIQQLVSIIKTKITNNAHNDVSSILDKVFPSNSSTTSAPIVSIIKNKNYLGILDYYKSTTVDPETHALGLVFDGTLIGNEGANIVVTFNMGNNGINNISINNVYALGYTLNCSFYLGDYQPFEILDKDKEAYTDLKYVNNIFDELASFIHKDQFSISLEGKMNLGKGDITLSGDSYVSISDNKDFGVAELVINGKDQSHNIKLDISRNKVDEKATEEAKSEALRTSDVLFSYNDKLKGYLNLESISDTFDLLQTLANEGNPLLDKIKGLLTNDSAKSTFTKIMAGEPEAILYDNSLESITYGSNANGSYYDIQLSGNLLKSDNDDVASPINIYLNLNNDHDFQGLNIKGSLNGYSLDVNLAIEEATENKLEWKRLTKDDSYYDFRELKTLTEYLFNTAKNNDYTLSGNINATLHLLLTNHNLSDIDLSAVIHLDDTPTGKKAIAKVVIDNIPHLPVSAYDWDNRTFTMYITDEEVILVVDYDYTELVVDWGDTGRYRFYHSSAIRLTMKQFTSKLGYYLINYGLGISTDTIDMNQSNSSNHKIDYSEILSSYTFYENTSIYSYDDKGKINGTIIEGPAWNLGISLSKLAGISDSILGDLNATIVGDKNTETLGYVKADTKVVGGLLTADLVATVDNFDPIETSVIEGIKEAMGTYSSYEYELEKDTLVNKVKVGLFD